MATCTLYTFIDVVQYLNILYKDLPLCVPVPVANFSRHVVYSTQEKEGLGPAP